MRTDAPFAATTARSGSTACLAHDASVSWYPVINIGPFEIVRVHDNGTVTLRKGAVETRVNIRHLSPFATFVAWSVTAARPPVTFQAEPARLPCKVNWPVAAHACVLQDELEGNLRRPEIDRLLHPLLPLFRSSPLSPPDVYRRHQRHQRSCTDELCDETRALRGGP